jgi:hypothetical protein
MNCENYLSMLATLPVEELAYGSAREHAANCRDCDRITRVVAEREHNMLMAFGDLYPSVPPGQIAARALVASRRRRVALYYRIGLGVATAATILVMIMSRRTALAPSATVSETFPLQCLSPDQAMEVLRLNLVSPSISLSDRHNSPVGVIRVGAPAEEMERVRAVLDRYDTPTVSQCAVQVVVPKVMKP